MTSSKTNPWIIAAVASIATFMEVLDTTITNVSLRHIAGSLGAGEDESTWVLTSYLVANGIILPLSGWISDAIGRKRFFIGCILGFTAASFLCGAASSLTEIIIFRILQGLFGGGLQPTQQAIILDTFPLEKRGTVFAITGVTIIIAPILGPTLGGLITDNFSWRWIFYINIPVGLMAAFMVWRLLDKSSQQKALGFRNIDVFGLSLVTLGLAALQIVLDKGQQEDWFSSSFITVWALICFVSLSIAIIWLWGQKDPIIDLSLFKNWAFASSCLLIFLTGFVLYGTNVILPLMLQTQYGYDATLAGLVLSPGGLALLFLMPLCGKLIGKIQARFMIMTGFALSALGMYHSMNFTPQTDFNTFQWIRLTQVLGLPFLFISISTLAFSKIPKEKSNKASALFALFRNIGGSVGIAVVTTFAVRQQQVHQHYLVEHLVPGQLPYQRLLNRIIDSTGDTSLSMGKIYQMLQKQAALCAYIDTFELLGYIMCTLIFFALLVLPANRPMGQDIPVAH
ncbi:MAG: DHA2 family efflux MFS transporter permease subunit [Candidatus Paracaedibacteraceae bacterium]|nr:DHA2 family efflux MFS transporter permease subunit [Candidatus Paracaedibacteraceae bacterium]